jgi:glucuronoarabinoxylan endo-1,4-beta-xylanase
VQVTIYDVLGRKVKKFTLGVQPGGAYSVVWDGRNDFGKNVAKGIYFYRIQVGGETQVKKMILGSGEGNFDLFLPQTFSPKESEMNKELAEFFQEGSFIVRIENTDNTSPPITHRQIEDVIIQSDTTLNFTVANAVTVYLDSARQVIRGFGAANIVPWRPDMTANQINTAFGTGTGQIGFTILRLRIPHQQNEFGLNVPTAQSAAAMGVKIIASPWTPPAWMKTNNNIVGGRLKEDAYDDYAAHLKSFADFMSANGVSLDAISVQNEPDVTVTYESCDWNAAEMLRFMKENASAVGTPIFAPESFNFNKTISNAILNDSIAAANTAFIGGHIYGGGLEPYPLAVSKGKEIWMTEHLELTTDWPGALATAKEINDCMSAGMSAYIWWYIVRFYGPILEDGNVSKRGYVMSQYARFIRPGFLRVTATENPRPNVYVTAYKDGAKVVIVAINNGPRDVDQTFAIPNGNVAKFTPYVTSSSKNTLQENDIPVSNVFFTATLEQASITTFVSD